MAQGPVTFYDFPLAYNPAKARIMLVEKQIPYVSKVINILSAEGVSPEFLKINPKATLPALRDGDKLLTESKDIVLYLDSRDGKPLGSGQVPAGLVKEWVDLIAPWDGNLYIEGANPSAGKLIGFLGAGKKKAIARFSKQHPELKKVYEEKLQAMESTSAKGKSTSAIEQNRLELEAICDRADATLARTPYLAGDAYSAADALLSVVIWRTSMAGQLGMYLKPRPNLSKWFNGIKARPSYDKVFGPAASPTTAIPLLLPALWGSLVPW